MTGAGLAVRVRGLRLDVGVALDDQLCLAVVVRTGTPDWLFLADAPSTAHEGVSARLLAWSVPDRGRADAQRRLLDLDLAPSDVVEATLGPMDPSPADPPRQAPIGHVLDPAPRHAPVLHRPAPAGAVGELVVRTPGALLALPCDVDGVVTVVLRWRLAAFVPHGALSDAWVHAEAFDAAGRADRSLPDPWRLPWGATAVMEIAGGTPRWSG